MGTIPDWLRREQAARSRKGRISLMGVISVVAAVVAIVDVLLLVEHFGG
jgi:hypothetical protein